MKYLFKVGIVVSLWWTSSQTVAEPWLANRFAQNCAGCHAPGRKNLPPPRRRCTLSCQGCHVNPNGSGMRSFYGKWNEDVFLRSYLANSTQKKKPLPYRQQPYAKASWKKRKSVAIQKGMPIKWSRIEEVPEELYDRRDRLEFVNSKTLSEFYHQIPEGDPLRQTERTKIDGGADLRWQINQYDVSVQTSPTDTTSIDGFHSFLMSAAFGLRYRPFHKGLHFVIEGQYLGSPAVEKKFENFFDPLSRKSAYVLVDDLPYNTYVMSGVYRPIFGYVNPDHTNLAQQVIAQALTDSPRSYSLAYQAVTVGGSPNVPFANISVLGSELGAAKNESNNGFVINTGGRFVSAGFSFTYSFWKSSKKKESEKSAVSMHDLGVGASYGRVTGNVNLTLLSKDVENDYFGRGAVISYDFYTRLWKQLYLHTAFVDVNTAVSLRPGSAEQLQAGLRWFVSPGVDLSLGVNQEEEITQQVDAVTQNKITSKNLLHSQFHVYF
ncbi:MAG: hypothetical protein OXT67_13365 [Zetaproteobacteria bacterium]|nr:hypothetical protein [Zetaproteobacteria bacterium]